MRGLRPSILDKVETDYIRSQIDTGDNIRIKNALQRLCKSYRLGIKARPDQTLGMVNAIVGTAYQSGIDEKVRRWVLNALARVGNEASGIPAVLHLLKRHGNEPQTIASGVAAVYKLCRRQRPDEVLASLHFDPQMRTLAALQHAAPEDLDMGSLPVDVETASPDLLKLALIVVGLGRSPENLLNPRHSDAEMVRVLGGHDDSIVSQYSVWAITENGALSAANLGIDVRDIDDHPPNVRGWVLQLFASEATKDKPHWEVVRHGMSDPSIEARRGLALGLRNTFVDVFEPLILEWVAGEADAEVRQHLMEHIVRQAARSRAYERYAIEIYDTETQGSPLRQSMEASAVQTPIYVRFKEIDAGAYGDLFGARSVTMVEKQYNIGSVQGGAVNVGDGTATNYGSTHVQVLSQQQIEAVHAELSKLEAALHESSLEPEQKNKALAYVADAKSDPSPTKVSKVIEFIGHLGTLAEAGTALAPYAAALGATLGI